MQSNLNNFFKSPSKKRTLDQVTGNESGTASQEGSKKMKTNDGKIVTVASKSVSTQQKKTPSKTKQPKEDGKNDQQKEGTGQQIEEVKEASANSDEDPLANLQAFQKELGTWQPALQNHMDSPSFRSLFTYVKSEYTNTVCYPPRHLIFNAFKTAKFDDLKIVIVGQDPYIKENEAVGLSFSVPKTTKCPPSLRQIYNALDNDKDIDFSMPKPLHGDLTRWANQGVFLLNAILTVRKGLSNSHQKKGWEQFSEHVIKTISKDTEGVVFMLWGKKAHEKAKHINQTRHLVLQNVHPSPLAGQGFRTIPDFSKANSYLVEQGKSPIDWNVI